MTSYEFQSGLYRNLDEMLAAIADAFLSADGNNPPNVIAEILAGQTDDELAKECVEEWGLDRSDDYSDYPEDAPKSHLEKHGYTASDLEDAFAEYRETFKSEGQGS